MCNAWSQRNRAWYKAGHEAVEFQIEDRNNGEDPLPDS